MILKVVFIIWGSKQIGNQGVECVFIDNKMKSQICGKYNDKKATR